MGYICMIKKLGKQERDTFLDNFLNAQLNIVGFEFMIWCVASFGRTFKFNKIHTPPRSSFYTLSKKVS